MTDLAEIPRYHYPTDGPGVEIHLVAVCLDCRKKHEYRCSPAAWLHRMEDWRQKHLGHRIEFRSPRRRIPRRLPRALEQFWSEASSAPWWLSGLSENADIKVAYASSADYTITLASLATSSTLVAGRQSTVISNTTNLYLDYLVGGKITTGSATLTAATIEAYFFGSFNDTPTYPDALGASDAAWTATSADIKRAGLKQFASIPNDTNANRTYPIAAVSLAAAYGGLIPKNHGVAVTHASGQNLNATGSNQQLSYTGAYLTSA